MAENFKIPASTPAGSESTTGVVDHDDPRLSGNIIMQGDQQPAPVDDKPKKLTPEERAQRKAKVIRAFERGLVHDRLSVPLPPHVHGEWCRNDPLEIDRLKTLGFIEDREYAPKRALHNNGSDTAIVGDVIHMICPRELKEIIDEVRQEQFERMNGKPGDPKSKTREERDFENNSRASTGDIVPIETTSTTRSGIDPNDVRAALAEVDRQTRSQSS